MSLNGVATKADVQETVVESLVNSLNQTKQELAEARMVGQQVGHMLRVLVALAGDDGAVVLTPDQLKAAEDTTVKWSRLEDGSVALITE